MGQGQAVAGSKRPSALWNEHSQSPGGDVVPAHSWSGKSAGEPSSHWDGTHSRVSSGSLHTPTPPPAPAPQRTPIRIPSRNASQVSAPVSPRVQTTRVPLAATAPAAAKVGAVGPGQSAPPHANLSITQHEHGHTPLPRFARQPSVAPLDRATAVVLPDGVGARVSHANSGHSFSAPAPSSAAPLIDADALMVLKYELSMPLGELDCVASGFVSLENYRTIATTLGNLSKVLLAGAGQPGPKWTLAGVPTSPTEKRISGASSPHDDDSVHGHVVGQREQLSTLLELLSPRSSTSAGAQSPRVSRQSGASAAAAAAAGVTSTPSSPLGPAGTPEWVRLQHTVMTFRIADHMTQDPALSDATTPRANRTIATKVKNREASGPPHHGTHGKPVRGGGALRQQPHPPLIGTTTATFAADSPTSRFSSLDDGDTETRLTVDDLLAVTEKDEALQFFLHSVCKQMPELAKKLRVMSPSAVLEFSLLEAAFKVHDNAVVSREMESDLQGIKKVTMRTAPYSIFYLQRMVDALPLSLSSLFGGGGYLTPLEPVVAPYACCSHVHKENAEFFLSMEDRARLLQLSGVHTFASAEVLLLHIGILSNYVSNILSSFSLFILLACAKRLGDIRRLATAAVSTTPDGLAAPLPVDTDGIPLNVESMEVFVSHCCDLYSEWCAKDLEQIRRQYPNVFILSAMNAETRDKAPVTTIAVSTLVKLIYLFAGGIGSISADDRRATAVLLEELTATNDSTKRAGAAAGGSVIFANSSTSASASTFASTGDHRGFASTRSATDVTDDVALAAALRIASLSRLGMLSKLMGLDITNSSDEACVATARACAATWRVLFQYCGVLPYEKCPDDMREWIHLFPLYALDTPSKRALLHVHAMLSSTPQELVLAPVMRERVLLTTSILLQKEMEKREASAPVEKEKSSEKRAESFKAAAAPQATSTVIRPVFASHDRGIEVSRGHGVCTEFYELCATEAVSEYLPPVELLRYVDTPRPVTAEERAHIPALAAYKHHLIVVFRWASPPVAHIHRGDDIAFQVVARKPHPVRATPSSRGAVTFPENENESSVVVAAAASEVSNESSFNSSGAGSSHNDEHSSVSSISLVAPNDNDLPLSAPLEVAVKERHRRRSLFTALALDEARNGGEVVADAPPLLRSALASASARQDQSSGPKAFVSDVSQPVSQSGAKSHKASRLASRRTSDATDCARGPKCVTEQRLTVIGVVDGGTSTCSTPQPRRYNSARSLPVFVEGKNGGEGETAAATTGTTNGEDIQYVVFNIAAGSEAWNWHTQRISALTHHRRTRPPFRVAEDTAYAWSNAQYDMEVDASRNANIPFTVGWLLGNTLANEVAFQSPLAPLAFRLLARSITCQIPIENLVLRPADLSLLGDRWTEHVLEASLGQSEDSLVDLFGLRAWKEEEEMGRSGRGSSTGPNTARSRHITALRRVVRAIANELCWNVQGDALLSRLFWSEVARGVQTTSLATSPLFSQCCARTMRTLLCGRMDSIGSNFAFREQFLLFFDMSGYHHSYHSAVSKESVRCMDEDLTAAEKRELLRFITGRSLLPSQAKTEFLQIVFTEVDPLMTPRACDLALRRLPSSFSCDNVLMIPNYFCCLLLGTNSAFVRNRVPPEMQNDYSINEDDFSTAWNLLNAAERTRLREDYRALLGQRLRTAVYESGPLDDGVGEVGEGSAGDALVATGVHTGFRRSVVIPGTAQVAHTSLPVPSGYPALDNTAGSLDVGSSVGHIFPPHTATNTANGTQDKHAVSQMSDLLELLSGPLFDEVAEDEDENRGEAMGAVAGGHAGAAGVRHLPRAGGATAKAARKTEEAGDYYRLLVAHAKRVKAEMVTEELNNASALSSSSSLSVASSRSSRGAPSSHGSKLTVKQGAVLYNDGPTRSQDSDDNEWVPRKFLDTATTTTAELVSPKRKPAAVALAAPLRPAAAAVSATESGPSRSHTAASFTLSSTHGSLMSDTDGAAAAATAAAATKRRSSAAPHSDSGSEAATSPRAGKATVPHSKHNSLRPTATETPETDHNAAALIAQAEALLLHPDDDVSFGTERAFASTPPPPQPPSSNNVNTLSARAAHRLKLRFGAHPDSAALADQEDSLRTDDGHGAHGAQQSWPLAPASSVGTQRNGTPLVNEIRSEPRTLPPALRDLAARYNVLHRKSIDASHNPPTSHTSAPPADLCESSSHNAGVGQSRRRSSVDKAIDELFPESIDF